MQKKIIMAVLVILFCLCVAGGVYAAALPTISRSVMASGGGSDTAGNSILLGVVGQSVVGGRSYGTTYISSGFLSGGIEMAGHSLYLPLVTK